MCSLLGQWQWPGVCQEKEVSLKRRCYYHRKGGNCARQTQSTHLYYTGVVVEGHKRMREGRSVKRFERQAKRESNQSFHQRPVLQGWQLSNSQNQSHTTSQPFQAQQSAPDHELRWARVMAELLKFSHLSIPRTISEQMFSLKPQRSAPKGPSTGVQVLLGLIFYYIQEFAFYSVIFLCLSCCKGSFPLKSLDENGYIIQGPYLSCGDTS